MGTLRVTSIEIDPAKKYSRSEVQKLLDFTPAQLKVAEEKKLILFFDNQLYGVYFFQFLSTNAPKLEAIHNA